MVSREHQQLAIGLKNLVTSEAEMNYRLGNQNFVIGNYEKAIHYYKSAIELKPTFFKAHANIHLSYEKIGKTKHSELHKKIATDLNTFAIDFGGTNTCLVNVEAGNIEIGKKGFEKLRNSKNPSISQFAKLNLNEIENLEDDKKEEK